MDRLQTLFQGYLDHRLSADEFVELFELLAEEAAMNTLTGPLQALWEEQPTYRLSDAHWDERMEAIKETMSEKGSAQPARAEHRGISRRWSWAAAATVTAILVSSGAYWYIHRQHTPTIAAVSVKQDVAPGGNKAILTLSGGSTIILDSAANGTLAQQGSANVVKLNNGQLAYEAKSNFQPGATMYNTLATPRGGQYQLTLPDGSKVWLNAASSITYPTAFTGNNRSVTISGEAYFEISPDSRKPFFVRIGSTAQVQVLGTHFNICAYSDEPEMATTLLEGSIRFAQNWGNRYDVGTVLKPGQEALLSKSDDFHVDNHVDIDQIMAWKNGQISFTNVDFVTLMRQISRWYDVDIKYPTIVPQRHFFGRLSRSVYLSTILEFFKENGINIEQKGKVLTVLPRNDE